MLYAPSYREKYAGFLRIDFPRIPFTSDYELFKRMAELGKRLVGLHLLRSSELDPPIARFQGEGDGKVETGKEGLRYDAKSERVYINESQYFEGVPPEVGSTTSAATRCATNGSRSAKAANFPPLKSAPTAASSLPLPKPSRSGT